MKNISIVESAMLVAVATQDLQMAEFEVVILKSIIKDHFKKAATVAST